MRGLRPVRSRRSQRIHNRRRVRRSFFESLEVRNLLTTTVFLDFGAGIGMGSTLSTTATGYRNIFGASTGTNMTNGTNAFPAGLNGGDSLDITPLNYDFDLDGDTDNDDISAFSGAVLPIVQRALEPFDFNVVLAAATSLADAVGLVGANAGDATGEFDAYNFIATLTSDGLGGGSVGNTFGLFGRASGNDLSAQAGNTLDEATLTFADNIIGSTSGTPGTTQYNQNLAFRIAYTAAHEAFHTFTYRHTPDESNSAPPATANQRLLASGDVIRRGSNTRENPFIVTRFDLQHDPVVAEPNNYLLAANDADIGLRDDNGDGVPNLAYVSGTGAHDVISLVNGGNNLVNVTVSAYSNSSHTSLIASESYTIDLLSETDGVILIDGSINNDQIVIDSTIDAFFRVRGGVGIDGVATELDEVIVRNISGGAVTVTHTGVDSGTIDVDGGAFVDFSETEPIALVGSPADLIVNLPDAADPDVVLGDDGAAADPDGTEDAGVSAIDGSSFEYTEFSNPTNSLTVNLGGLGATVAVSALDASFAAPILLSGGGLDDTLVVDSSSGLITSRVYFDGGPGFDRLDLRQTGGATRDSSEVIVGAGPGSGQSVIVDGNAAQVVSFQNLEPITDSVPAATFSITGVSGIASLLQGPNEINYEEGLLMPSSGRVTVDNFEPIEFSNKTNLVIDAGAGSDLINLNNPTTPTGLAGIRVNSDDPTANSDTVVVNGTAALNTITVNTLTDDGAVVTGAQPVPVTVDTTETLVIVGQGGGDNLTISGTALADDFEHRPGPAADQGFVGVRSSGRELLGTRYKDLGSAGTVTVAGGGGIDLLSALGTGDSDVVDVTFTNNDDLDLDLISAYGVHVDLRSDNIEVYEVDTLGGDDRLSITDGGNSLTGSLRVFLGGPGDSDLLQFFGTAAANDTIIVNPAFPNGTGTAMANAVNVNYSGVEHIFVEAEGDAGDNLTVGDPGGDDTWVVTANATFGGDRIQINDRETIDYLNFDDVTIRNNFGADLFQVHPTHLAGFNDTFTVRGSGDDNVLQVIGTEDGDTVTTTATVVTTNTMGVTLGTGLGRLDIITLGGTDNIDLNALTIQTHVDAGVGDDVVNAAGVTNDNVRLTLSGGLGNDNLIGGDSPTGSALGDILLGGPGDDRLEGGRGRDQFFGGEGSDLFVWVAGDGSDLMEGGNGNSDELQFIANDGSTRLELFGGGLFNDGLGGFFPAGTLQDASRAIFALNFGQVFLNTADVENFDVDALGGRDQIVINNQVDTLTPFIGPVNVPPAQDNIGGTMDGLNIGTDLAHSSVRGIDVDLGGTTALPTAPDGAGDLIEVHARLVEDNIDITTQTDAAGNVTVDVAGLDFSVRIRQPEADNDRLQLHGQAGDDNIKAAAGVENSIAITLDGDEGNDILSADAVLNGGAGNDILVGGAGSDTLNGNSGDDTLVVSPGADTFSGGSGFDVILYEGNDADNTFSLSQAGNTITVGGIVAGTIDVSAVDIERIDVNGKAGDDGITLIGLGIDALVNAGSGDDIVDASGGVGTARAEIHGGDGFDAIWGTANNDFITGGGGNDYIAALGGVDDVYGGLDNDIIIGGTGNDILFGGPDSDTFVWDPGDGSDLMEGGTGEDVLDFNGAAGADTFTMSQLGTRLRFAREPGGVVLDVADVEDVDVNRDVSLSGSPLNEAQAGGTGSLAVGEANVRFDAVNSTISVDVFVQGIAAADVTGFHLHQAPTAVNGPVIVGLNSPGPFIFKTVPGGIRLVAANVSFPAANIADLVDGNTYFNLHTTAFPAGEIRGQVGAGAAAFNPGGADTFTVQDLTATTVREIDLNVDLPPNTGDANDDGLLDDVTLHGYTIADDVNISVQAGAVVDIAGLAAEVRIHNAEINANAALSDELTVEGNEGDDSIKAEPGVENTIEIILRGGPGDDFLSADATLVGGDGDDVLVGGLLSDVIFGDDPNDAAATGEDTIVASPGNDTIDGGPQFDTILIRGSADADLIDVRQTAANLLLYDVNAPDANADLAATDTITSIEQATVEAGAGADTIRLAIADSLFNSAGASLRMNVVGGDDQASDRLGIVDADTADMSILRQAYGATAGTVVVGPANPEPFLHTFVGIEFTQVLADTLAPSGSPTNVESPAVPNRLAVFKHDLGELNNDRNNATHLGANETVNLDPTIDPGPGAFGFPADTDWYRVEAEVTGTIDFQVFFEQIAAVGGRPGLPGNGNLNLNIFDSDGQAIANFNTSDDNDDNERARIPAVQGEVYYFQVVGLNDAINAYDVTVINLPALIPYDLELDDELVGDPPPNNSDTGRSHHDNITRDNTPTVVLRLSDNFFLNDLPGNDTTGTPIGDAAIPIPFRAGAAQPTLPGYAIAIFDEGDTPGGPGVEEPQTPLGFATLVEPGVYQFTTPSLTDGSHFLTARVQMLDPANPLQTGFGLRSVSLEIVVDTVVPPISFGAIAVVDDGLHPDSDSGVAGGLGNENTLDDNITNDETPTFWGRAEADAFVRVYVDVNDNGIVDNADFKIGQTTALPLDGNNQFPSGQWELTSTYNMNDPQLLAALAAGGVIDAGEIDQRRPILVTAEDVPGNVSPPQSLNIFVDTQGPQVTSVYITAASGYNLWDHKDNPDGTLVPTPLIDAISIDIRDLPDRYTGFLYNALAENSAGDPAQDPGNYRLAGDYNGIIPIASVAFNPDAPTSGNPATGTIVLSFSQPLPDDRFTLTLNDNLVDPAGNNLDGESNAAEPQDPPVLPSGDGQPGGDFVARFTVDSRPELGNWGAGSVWIDTNGNFRFDPGNPDFTNRDITYTLGNGSPIQSDHLHTSDDVFAGNFYRDPNGTADGFDKLAAYGSIGLGAGGPWRWIIDTDSDGVPDINQIDPLNVNGLPIAGNFDVAAQGLVQSINNGDEVAVFTGTQWVFDTDHNFQLNGNAVLNSNLRGYPIVGDFDGDGLDDLGVWSDDRFQFDLSGTGATVIPGLQGLDGTVDAEIQFGFIGVRERPVAADMDQDGIDDIGLWTPDRAGQTPDETAEWYFLISNDPTGAVRQFGTVNTLAHPFEPVPFGHDLYALFGDQFAIPVIGNFDPPPVADAGDPPPVDTDPEQTNPRNHLDVDNDTVVAPRDALRVIEFLNKHGAVQFKWPGEPVDGNYYDVDDNTVVSTRDALLVINYLNALAQGTLDAEGESSSPPARTNAFEQVVIEPLAPANSAATGFQFVISPADVQTDSIVPETGQETRQTVGHEDETTTDRDSSLVTAPRATLGAARRSAPTTDQDRRLSNLENILDEIISDVTWGDENERDRLFQSA